MGSEMFLNGFSLGSFVINAFLQSSLLNLLEKMEIIIHITYIIPFIIAIIIFSMALTTGYKTAKTCIKTINEIKAGTKMVIKKLNKSMKKLPFLCASFMGGLLISD